MNCSRCAQPIEQTDPRWTHNLRTTNKETDVTLCADCMQWALDWVFVPRVPMFHELAKTITIVRNNLPKKITTNENNT